MPEEPNNLSLYAEQMREEQEVPILSPEWLNVLESDYIDTFDDALDVLEDAQQVNAMDVLEDRSAHYIDQ
ncbi:hypothetical protein [Desulfoscipio gibsoniae]|uniref:Uncharacterized protein n=1 Tax=Desulfoscipio gibsoniae DSM 7213 TaxID=767817 RepID=R4KM71_9FIRM|nr:hypothetical protein [Desulfoscipio gibsoniae]AGL01620.1 hypothetical protein Desgi_2191 [Desulfoscipio gibsoniae DSM 7213]